METIKDTVRNVIQSLEAHKEGAPSDKLTALLKKVLTKRELGHIKLDYFKKGILNVKVDSSVWLYHLSLQKENLLNKLRHKNSGIKGIRFRIGDTK